MCVRCALLPLLLLQNNVNGYESTLLRYIWRRFWTKQQIQQKKRRMLLLLIGDEGDEGDDDDCRWHGITER